MPLTEPKPHGVFWVVITLVLNTLVYGLIVLIVVSMALRFILAGVALTRLMDHAIMAAMLCLSVLAATQHSLKFIETRAIVTDPSGCIVPSIATFAGVTAGLNALAISAILRGDVIASVFQLSSGAASILLFAWMTRRFFRRLASERARGFEVQPPPVLPLAEKPPAQ